MPELAKHFHVVAIDQRGYNLSGQPEGVENYKTDKLVGDVVAVVKHFGPGKAVIVGHDWGGLVAWTFAMTHPELTDRLDRAQPAASSRAVARAGHQPRQQKNSQYARNFQKPDAAKHVSVEFSDRLGQRPRGAQGLSRRVQAIVARRNAQLLQGKLPAHCPMIRTKRRRQAGHARFPSVKCSVLLIHGLKDQALLPGALNDTWKWIDNDLTLVTIPAPAISSSKMPPIWSPKRSRAGSRGSSVPVAELTP